MPKTVSTPSKRKVHGVSVLWDLLNTPDARLRLYPKIGDLRMLLQEYSKISIEIANSNIRNLSEYGEKDYFLGKYFEILENVIKYKETSIREFFRKVISEDNQWVNEIIKRIMQHGGGDTVILKEMIEDTYKRIIKIKMDTTILEKIKKDLEKLNSDSVEKNVKIKDLLKLTPETMNYLSENGIILRSEMKAETYLGAVNEFYYDRLLYIENMINSVEGRRWITPLIKEKYNDIVKILEKGDDERILKRFTNINIMEIDYISEDEYKKLVYYLRHEFRMGVRSIPSLTLENKLEDLYLKFKDLPIQKSEQHIDLKPLMDELPDVCINYVKVKVSLEMQNRQLKEKDEKEGGGKKETFYQTFSRLKKELTDESVKRNYHGFTEYIREKERESKRTNLNV